MPSETFWNVADRPGYLGTDRDSSELEAPFALTTVPKNVGFMAVRRMIVIKIARNIYILLSPRALLAVTTTLFSLTS